MRSKKSVTLHDIAQALQISVSSVSFAIGNQPGISAELRAQIIAKAKSWAIAKANAAPPLGPTPVPIKQTKSPPLRSARY